MLPHGSGNQIKINLVFILMSTLGSELYPVSYTHIGKFSPFSAVVQVLNGPDIIMWNLRAYTQFHIGINIKNIASITRLTHACSG